MQKILNLSKFVILLILSCSLLLTWYSNKVKVINFVPAYINETEREYKSDNNNKSLWNSLREEFQLDTRAQSSQVQAEIRKLLAEPNKLSNIFKAAVPYIYFIHEQTTARGLPAEIALIPVIESEFNPNDKSNKGATGLWQLMRVTAHELGIKVQEGYDGRRNVIFSTKAALAYFKDLGNLFGGNWYLAIAAYNCGQGRVLSAMHKTGRESFWGLPLPQETKYYVPRLLAVAEIVKNPKKYGVELPKAVNKPYFEEIKISKPVNLKKVAETSGVSIDTLNKLNPDYTKGSRPVPKKNAVTFLVPVEKVSEVKATLTNNKMAASIMETPAAKPAAKIIKLQHAHVTKHAVKHHPVKHAAKPKQIVKHKVKRRIKHKAKPMFKTYQHFKR